MMLDSNLLRQARSNERALTLVIGMRALVGFATIAAAWLISVIIDRVFLAEQSMDQVRTEMAVLLAVIILRAGLTWGADLAANSVALQVKEHLRASLFERLLALGPAYAHGEQTGELSATVMEGVEALDSYFSHYLPQLATAALIPIAILLVVFPIDLLSAIVLAITAPLIPFFMNLIGKSTDALTRRQFQTLGRLSARVLDSLQGLSTLKILGQSTMQVEAIEEASDRYRAATLRVLRLAFLSALVLELTATIGTAIVAVEVGLRLLYGRMAFQPALFLLLLAPEFYRPLRTLGQGFHSAASGVSAAQRIFAILSLPAPQPGSVAEGYRELDQEAAEFRSGSIEFRDVHYVFRDGRPALDGATLTIENGETVALVGPSGSGKSTIAQMLMRFIEPDQGEILVAGKPLGAWAPEQWRDQVSWVPQSPHLFHDTLEANLRVGDPAASEQAVIRAARQAHLHTFIESLPRGYRTVIGERGARLSGGQAQRLALARAFLKDAPLLLLDEPTSNVDPELETMLQTSLGELMADRTVLVIAHRLNTVFRADQIIVLVHGRVVETGRHADLMARHAEYRRLVGEGGTG